MSRPYSRQVCQKRLMNVQGVDTCHTYALEREEFYFSKNNAYNNNTITIVIVITYLPYIYLIVIHEI